MWSTSRAAAPGASLGLHQIAVLLVERAEQRRERRLGVSIAAEARELGRPAQVAALVPA